MRMHTCTPNDKKQNLMPKSMVRNWDVWWSMLKQVRLTYLVTFTLIYRWKIFYTEEVILTYEKVSSPNNNIIKTIIFEVRWCLIRIIYELYRKPDQRMATWLLNKDLVPCNHLNDFRPRHSKKFWYSARRKNLYISSSYLRVAAANGSYK